MKSEAQITLDEIFHAACALAPAERQRYLDEVCAGDDALRRKVEALLEHDDPESTFLENPALENAAKEMAFAARPSVTSKQPMIGRQIENYRVQALLGKGGMGEVYLARDLELDVDVAIKFLPAAYADDPEWQARFKREARLIAALKHPNITAIHRNGESEGRPFLVFEYVPGVTLEEKLKPGPLSPSDVLPLATQLAAALEQSGSWAQAKPLLEKVIERAPDSAPALNYIGYAMADRGEDLPRAIALLERGEPEVSLVITDLMMPGIDGLALARREALLRRIVRA